MDLKEYVASISSRDAGVYGLHVLNVGRVRMVADALKSGRFKKGTNYLDTIINGKHFMCCIGVMCNVAKAAGVNVPVETTGEKTFESELFGKVSGQIVHYEDMDQFAGRAVRAWFGHPATLYLPQWKDTEYHWDSAVALNDAGPDGRHSPEDSFEPTIAPAFYLLADIAELYQASHS